MKKLKQVYLFKYFQLFIIFCALCLLSYFQHMFRHDIIFINYFTKEGNFYEVFYFLMHNIYALGGTVKAVSQLANTLAERGHDVTIVSVLRAADTPYFALNNNIKVIDLVDYRLKPQNISGIIANRIRKFTPLLKPKKYLNMNQDLVNYLVLLKRKSLPALSKPQLMY